MRCGLTLDAEFSAERAKRRTVYTIMMSTTPPQTDSRKYQVCIGDDRQEVDDERCKKFIIRCVRIGEGVSDSRDDGRPRFRVGITNTRLDHVDVRNDMVSSDSILTCSWGKYLEACVVVNLPRHAAATLRVVSSEFSASSKRGAQRESATISSWPCEALVTT
jgi:hypothetical protein